MARLSIAPVKSLRLRHPDEVLLEPAGVDEDRRFFLVDDYGNLFTAIDEPGLLQVEAEVTGARLALRFPDGHVVEGEWALGGPVETELWDRRVRGRIVEGPWAAALSQFAGKTMRLVRSEQPGDGYDVHPVTLVSDGSLAALARNLDADSIDARRFRMLVDLVGCEPHEEDGWAGLSVRIGEAVVRVIGPVPRCAVTTRHPEGGGRDLDTLGAIRRYRGVREGRALDFGVYADVVEPGRVRVGDPVELLETYRSSSSRSVSRIRSVGS